MAKALKEAKLNTSWIQPNEQMARRPCAISSPKFWCRRRRTEFLLRLFVPSSKRSPARNHHSLSRMDLAQTDVAGRSGYLPRQRGLEFRSSIPITVGRLIMSAVGESSLHLKKRSRKSFEAKLARMAGSKLTPHAAAAELPAQNTADLFGVEIICQSRRAGSSADCCVSFRARTRWRVDRRDRAAALLANRVSANWRKVERYSHRSSGIAFRPKTHASFSRDASSFG